MSSESHGEGDDAASGPHVDEDVPGAAALADEADVEGPPLESDGDPRQHVYPVFYRNVTEPEAKIMVSIDDSRPESRILAMARMSSSAFFIN